MSGFTLCSGAKPGKRDLTRRWDCAHGTYFGGADDFRLSFSDMARCPASVRNGGESIDPDARLMTGPGGKTLYSDTSALSLGRTRASTKPR